MRTWVLKNNYEVQSCEMKKSETSFHNDSFTSRKPFTILSEYVESEKRVSPLSPTNCVWYKLMQKEKLFALSSESLFSMNLSKQMYLVLS